VLPRQVYVGLLRRLSNGGVRLSSNGIPKLEHTLQLQAKFTAEVYSSLSSWRLDAYPRREQRQVRFNRSTWAFVWGWYAVVNILCNPNTVQTVGKIMAVHGGPL
jgi:hypothetical protein